MKRFTLTLLLLLWTGLAAAVERPIYSTGNDQSAALQALYDAASDGDSIKLVPQDGKPFVAAKTLVWCSASKTVHVHAEGATINGSVAFGGVLSGGTAAGQRGYGNWKGGTINGNVELVNWCYSRWDASVTGTLSLVLDNCASYNTIRGNIGTPDGSGPAVAVDQRVPSAWANANTLRDCNLRFGKDGTIVQRDKTAYPLGVWRLYACNIEGSSGKLLSVGMAQILFADCYFEGAITLGDSDPKAHLVFRDLGGAVPWTLDPRVTLEGNQYQ
jgi:hypothetical protein